MKSHENPQPCHCWIRILTVKGDLLNKKNKAPVSHGYFKASFKLLETTISLMPLRGNLSSPHSIAALCPFQIPFVAEFLHLFLLL